ncbi:hypothetical protein EVB91_247 [Rhizobium phage RHph_I1_18]|nr:hypothetical protein EVB91_247 [Rhizobium phage RHph_I1_18]
MEKVTKEQVVQLLLTRDAAVERALVVLYGYQTADEQKSDMTSHENGQGFTGADAEYLSKMAKLVIRGVKLTPKQLEAIRGRNGKRGITKYAAQLARHANANPRQKASV